MSATTLRKLRKAAKLTQEEAAKRLAVHVTTVSNWESGRRSISPAMAKLIKSALT